MHLSDVTAYISHLFHLTDDIKTGMIHEITAAHDKQVRTHPGTLPTPAGTAVPQGIVTQEPPPGNPPPTYGQVGGVDVSTTPIATGAPMTAPAPTLEQVQPLVQDWAWGRDEFNPPIKEGANKALTHKQVVLISQYIIDRWPVFTNNDAGYVEALATTDLHNAVYASGAGGGQPAFTPAGTGSLDISQATDEDLAYAIKVLKVRPNTNLATAMLAVFSGPGDEINYKWNKLYNDRPAYVNIEFDMTAYVERGGPLAGKI